MITMRIRLPGTLRGRIEAMNFARSYLDFAERTGASTISWYGSPIECDCRAR